MKKNRAAWDERFGWMWYGSDVVYNWTDEDFDRAAKSFADAHFTTVILFGTHFRFSYWAYWEDIENAIAKITKAFHKYGIKVVEHHSSHLTYRIDDEAEWDSFAVKRHDDARFPKFRETSQANPILGGAHMDDFAQIDGSTGGLALSAYVHTDGKDADWIYKHYNGDAHCFNHPAFYKAYTEHLERIIKKANIDGIMNDDVQWFEAVTLALVSTAGSSSTKRPAIHCPIRKTGHLSTKTTTIRPTSLGNALRRRAAENFTESWTPSTNLWGSDR